MSEAKLRLFGGVRLVDGDEELPSFGTVRAAKLLVLLSLSRSGKMAREHLAENLWPDDYYDATRLRLRQEIHRLKRALGDRAELVGASATEVWVDRGVLQTDIDLLEQAVKHGRPVPEDVLLQPFLPGWDDPWVNGHQRIAEQLQVRAGIAIIARGVQAGEADRVQDLLQKMIAQHPLNEDLRKLAVEVHAQLGSLTAAVAEFQDYRRKVKEQLGVDAPDVSERLIQNLSSRTAERVDASDWSTTVPVSEEPIYGRDELVVRVIDQLQAAKTRVVTLVGPGGIGKTRLAIEVAQRLEGRVAFTSMVEVADPALWAREVLAQLGSDAPGEADPLKYLSALVAQEPTVIVLDNLETILPAAAEEIAQLRSLTPNLRLLITSVVPSRVSGEVLMPVGPLDPRVAGAEFLRNAYLQHRPNALISEADQQDLMQIADRLDGYPLALRLASARLRLLSPRDLLKQLEQALARSSAHDLPERHRSLESALASSFGSLDDGQRFMVERIAAYPGGMGMDLCALAFPDRPYLDLIESLLDLALLALDDHLGKVRVRMLVPVRNYVLQRMGATAQAAHEACAAAAICKFLEEHGVTLWQPATWSVMETLQSEADNIMFTWRWLLEHDQQSAWQIGPSVARLENSRGRSLALMEQLESLRPQWQDADEDDQVAMEFCIAHLSFTCHREERARQALDTAKARADLNRWGPILAVSEAQYAFRRDFDRCEDISREAVNVAQSAGAVYASGRAMRTHGVYFCYTRRPSEGQLWLRRALETLESVGAETELPSLGTFLGAVLWFTGHKAEALQVIEQARDRLRGLREPITTAFMLETEGKIVLDDGRPEDAERCLLEALRIWEAIGSPYQEADQLHCLSMVYIVQDRWEEARVTTLEAARRWILDSNFGGLCCTLNLLAHVLHHQGDDARARQVIAFAIDMEKEMNLALVETAVSHREAVSAEIGGEFSHNLPVTKEQAEALFDWIR